MISQILNGFKSGGCLKAGLVGLLLLLHAGLAIDSVREKSNTFDEIIHLTAGFTYWKFNDYRFQPENGNFPQRWVALPLLFQSPAFPEAVHNMWDTGHAFFFSLGNDADRMLLSGRVMGVLLSMALGFTVYLCSKRLFGFSGGMISLVLYTLTPTVLAHGRLATSDMAAALFFVLSVQSLWRMMHRMTWFSLVAASLSVACLLLSKMSGVLILPVFILLCLIRVIRGKPMTVQLGKTRRVNTRGAQVAFLALGSVVVVIVSLVSIWGAYGFRFSAAGDVPPYSGLSFSAWEEKLSDTGLPGEAIREARNMKLLPEAYLYGFAHVLHHSRVRGGFMNGRYSDHGWWHFFPFCLAVKTPICVMLILLMAISALALIRESDDLYNLSPFLVLGGVYLLVALSAKINIGHRHILLLYPVMFIVSGGVSKFYFRFKRLFCGLLPAFLVLLVLETQIHRPHYLAFFNPACGGPEKGYRLLVDSSLDWGQDLPGLKKWLEDEYFSKGGTEPVYLAYFGTASPAYYDIPATVIPLRPLPWLKDVEVCKGFLAPGWYCISATELQQVYGNFRHWGPAEEALYRTAEKELEAPKNGRGSKTLERFNRLRFARLCHVLRKREPDAHVGHSILIYDVTWEELNRGVDGNGQGGLRKNSTRSP